MELALTGQPSLIVDLSHRRYNPLTGSWVLVSPHRTKRPWLGQQEQLQNTKRLAYDPDCYLCPGNKRSQGDLNPDYDSTFVFVNDFSALQHIQPSSFDFHVVDSEDERQKAAELLQASPARGICYVMTFSAAHNITFPDMKVQDIEKVILVWTALYASHVPSTSLTKNSFSKPLPSLPNHCRVKIPEISLRWMQIFENKGSAVGCSNPHPHGQIWVSDWLPEEPRKELEKLIEYNRCHNGSHLLQDYVELECNIQDRVVYQNKEFVALSPWWAMWPFEIMIIPRSHITSLANMNDNQRKCLSETIADVTRRYDNLFETEFPYSMGIHQAPLQGTEEEIEASYFHIHFYPPLLRSATVRKFIAGYEMMAEPQQDITREQAAAQMRSVGSMLYRNR